MAPEDPRNARTVQPSPCRISSASGPANQWTSLSSRPCLPLCWRRCKWQGPFAPGGARPGAGRPARKSANTSPPSTRARARAREAAGNQRPWPADKVERSNFGCPRPLFSIICGSLLMAKSKISVAVDIFSMDFPRPVRRRSHSVGVPIGSTPP